MDSVIETERATSATPVGVERDQDTRQPRLADFRVWGRLAGSLLLAGAIGAFGLSRLDLDVSVVVAELLRAQPLLLAVSLVAYYGSMPLRAWRWRVILERSEALPDREARLPALPSLLRIYLLGWLVNCLLPAKAGEVYRTYLLRRQSGVRLSSTFGTVIFERASDLLALSSLFVIFGALVFGSRLMDTARHWVVWALLLALLVTIILAVTYALRGRLVELLPTALRQVFWGLQQGLFGGIERLPLIALLTAAIWSLEGVRFFAAAKAVGVSLPFAVAFLAALLASLLTTVPLTPAGVGVVETGVVGLLLLLGIAESSAVSVAILDRLVAYWSVLVIVPPVWAYSHWRFLRHDAHRA